MKPMPWNRLGALALAGLIFASNAFARPLELIWDKVTTLEDGSPAVNVRYRIYKKTTLEDFKFVFETSNSRWTWLVPSLGHYVFRVRATSAAGEGEASNELKIFIERIPRTE